MSSPVRIGAVEYLNTRPLVHGLDRSPAGPELDLLFDVPSGLARRMRAGELDVALLPVIELARIPGLEVVPGLGIVTRGASRSVFLLSRVAPERIESLALDPASCTSNVLARVLLHRLWDRRPQSRSGIDDLERALAECDAAIRIGDRALFEPHPTGCRVLDLGQLWTEDTGLSFVFAVWAARAGAASLELWQTLQRARDAGCAAIDTIAQDYTWRGVRDPERSRDYLSHHIRYDLGPEELTAMGRFFEAAAGLNLIDAAPEIRLGPGRLARSSGSPSEPLAPAITDASRYR